VAKLSVNPLAVPHFTLIDGLLKFKNKIYVRAILELKE
jgi:hypothetical protein